MEEPTSSTAKFCACFGYSTHDFQRRQKPDESVYNNMDMNVSAFKKMLIKNDMDEYTNELLYYWYISKLNASKKTTSRIPTTIEANKKRDEYEKDLTESLLFLLSVNSDTNMSVTFQKSRNSLTKNNNDIIKCIIDSLILEYDKNNFNEVELSFEEAVVEIENRCDLQWIKDFVKEDVRNNPDIFQIEEVYFDFNFDFEEAFEISYNDQMIEAYANEHYTKREITIEFLKSKIEMIPKLSKNKAGAKRKNDQIGIIGTNLSYLKRIDTFIHDSEKLKDINSVKLTNKDYRFIHDCLVFFGLIEDYSVKENTTTTPEKYLYTTLKQYDSNLKAKTNINERIWEIFADNRKIDIINKLKNVI